MSQNTRIAKNEPLAKKMKRDRTTIADRLIAKAVELAEPDVDVSGAGPVGPVGPVVDDILAYSLRR